MPKVNKPQLRFIVRGDRLALRCTFNGQSAEIKTELPSDGFDKKKQLYKGNRMLNISLDDALTPCEKKIGDGITDVREILSGENTNTFTYIVEKYVKDNDLAFNTRCTWRAIKNHLIECFGDNKNNFNEKQLLKYFTNKGIGESSIALYLSKITALGFDVSKKVTKKYKVGRRDYYLNRQQLVAIRNTASRHIKSGTIYDGLLFFAVLTLTGLSPIDLAVMKRTHVSFVEIEREYVKKKYIQLVGHRLKTGVSFKIVLEYKGHVKTYFDYLLQDKGVYLFHIMDGIEDDKKQKHRMANYLRTRTAKVKKIISNEINPRILKINKFSGNNIEEIDINKFTFYVARHSVSMALLLHHVSPAQISMFLGRSISNLSSYFHELEALQMTDISKSLY